MKKLNELYPEQIRFFFFEEYYFRMNLNPLTEE